ncbi:cysteine proteinase inhibitor 5 [Jatropha curcas]|uniref:cysteine proteinase inhibitor 5 n=1 Tax=Jatropha curcas TaxID=180498 RepID=UPI001893770E|nr:cysteine proteinase inhibitor 5 [Jatropha curcas]
MSRQCLLLCLLFVVSGAAAAARLGGWQPIKNLNDPHVVEIANYAVGEYNKRSTANLKLNYAVGEYNKRSTANLKLEKVVKGETQVVAGTNYRLVLEVNGGASKDYEAVVWEKTWENFKNLTSFKPVKA